MQCVRTATCEISQTNRAHRDRFTGSHPSAISGSQSGYGQEEIQVTVEFNPGRG